MAKNLRTTVTQWILALCLAGCASPERGVEKQTGFLRDEWQKQVEQQSNLSPRPIDWPTGVEQLRNHNLRLRQARMEVTNAQEFVRQVYRDLTPTLDLRSGVSRSLRNIPTTGFDDVTFSADGFLNVPGIVSFNARLFGAKLTSLRAEAACELTERTQTLELYKSFIQMQAKGEAKVLFDLQRRAAEALVQSDALAAQRWLVELDLQKISMAQEQETLNQKLGELLGDRSVRWILSAHGLPKFDYEQFVLKDRQHVAQLQMKLVAIEMEAARARLKGVKLQYWPELYLFVSGPPLYQRDGGSDRFWDAGDVRASADFFWQIDTRGNTARELRQTKRSQELQMERLRQESQDLIAKLLAAQKMMGAVREQLDRLKEQFALFGQLPALRNFQNWEETASGYRFLVEQQQKLHAQQAELQTLFWFVDDEKWKN